MIKNKKIFVLYRLLFGLLGLSAVATEIATLIQRGIFVPGNFFSFFTIQSNLLASAIFLVGAVLLVKGKPQGVRDLWRGASTLYMVVTGIVFAVLLSGLDAGVLTAVPWDNTVLHYIMPVAVLFDWLIDPPKRRISFKQALVWLVYPVAYLLYTLLRGNLTAWYPYPFLNVNEKGYTTVLITSVGVAIIVAGLAWFMTKVNRRATKV